jgi:hypothetical protein
MSELVTKSVPQEQQEQRIETRTAVNRIGRFAIVATSVAVLAVLGAVVLYAQSQDNDKYSLKSPSGVAFSDFRGYEDWAVISSAHTDERRKLSSWKRTARDLQKAAGGDTRCLTTMPRRTSSRPIPRAHQTADTRAIRQSRRRTTSSTRTKSVEPLRASKSSAQRGAAE